MQEAIQRYLEFCGLFRGGIFFRDMKSVSPTAYWIAVFLTMGLTLLISIVLMNADDKNSAGRAGQLYLATAAVSTVLFGIEVPFLVLLMSLGLTFILKRDS